ncbi:fibrobacter succinogenes major paralogous domain-containing protein [Mucilaginibacter paludis]|uniref:Fibrobacter succinogenes major paralogous domain-containing protein n=1 Tax=Mucilaginibacter paludis DSM 18603 TaxID=714943 RepID=H1YIV8_9SPHI|nr:fibrobacter succinogenes major paralogous domain-containing protein [Mucilaginibacter paludis]EHQ27653.1 hypothetical protein Mucpa_3555 [Mucilaginibacter paludis DSM 18603]
MKTKRLKFLRCLKKVHITNQLRQSAARGNNFVKLLIIMSGFLATCNVPGTLKDIDGNIYHTVKIGNQIWMAENLRTTHFSNGNPISQISNNKAWERSTAPAFCFYDNDKEKGKTYGPLYNWYAVNDSRGLAPKGWHIPTKMELDTLLKNTIGSDTLAAAFLKEPGNKHWLPAIMETVGASGFNALPAGYRHRDGSFHSLKSNTYFWTGNFTFELYNWSSRLFYGFADVDRELYYRQYGFSVRCIKD